MVSSESSAVQRQNRCAGGKFSGDFDVNVFAEVHKSGDLSLLPDVSVEIMLNIIEDATKPSVAAIQGLALGGGLELTMGCHARISTPEAQLGLPELTLGVIPGFGVGTQRLPRLVGLPKALEMMLLSKSIRTREGKDYGLIDAITSPEELIRVSIDFGPSYVLLSESMLFIFFEAIFILEVSVGFFYFLFCLLHQAEVLHIHHLQVLDTSGSDFLLENELENTC